MIVYYHPRYNINLGILNHLHPFDGNKFKRVFQSISRLSDLKTESIREPISQAVINGFVGDLLRRLLPSKRYILQALEVPNIPLLPFSMIEKRILEPMRWAVSGTVEAAKKSLTGTNTWNMAGGYHHASRSSAEGFCIYNDIGITMDLLLAEKAMTETDRLLIIDVDAHHGNGNSYVFMEHENVCILDIYNDDIYPNNKFTKKRVDINIPLKSKTDGNEYLPKLQAGLAKIESGFKLAFVVAGTDVLESDPLGGLGLSIGDCVARDGLILEKLKALSIPAVFLGGGGYGRDSAVAMTESISAHYRI